MNSDDAGDDVLEDGEDVLLGALRARGEGKLSDIGGLDDDDDARGVGIWEPPPKGPLFGESDGRFTGVSLAVSKGLSGLLKRPAMAWAKRSTPSWSFVLSMAGAAGAEPKKPSIVDSDGDEAFE